jgi:hypothetical protein
MPILKMSQRLRYCGAVRQGKMMRDFSGSPLVVCYISGMDVRRLTPDTTPFLAQLLEVCPHTNFVNLPSNELFPTLVTGVSPDEHGVWGVQYEANPPATVIARLADALPDFLTTSTQCIRHFMDNTYDLAAIPPRRRRHLKFTRTKYRRRQKRPEALYNIGGIPTVMDVVGRDRSEYSFSCSGDPVADGLPKLCENGALLEIMELYSLDRHQQWNLDSPSETSRFYGVIDDFVRQLHEKCLQKNKILMIVSDHGHEPILDSIDLCAKLREMDLTDSDLSYFIEVSSVRLWFHTDVARKRVTEWLADLPAGKLVRYDAMSAHNVNLADERYGEYFFFLDPGYIFFPHDFHHPMARLFFGLTDPMQRSRLIDPRHRGNHGHLAHFEAEKSLMLLADTGFESEAANADILHVAPSILSVIGAELPPTMSRPGLFKRCA